MNKIFKNENQMMWTIIAVLSLLLVGFILHDVGYDDGYRQAEKKYSPETESIFSSWDNVLRVSVFVASLGFAIGFALHGPALIRR